MSNESKRDDVLGILEFFISDHIPRLKKTVEDFIEVLKKDQALNPGHHLPDNEVMKAIEDLTSDHESVVELIEETEE